MQKLNSDYVPTALPAKKRAKPSGKQAPAIVFSIAIVALLIWGWSQREEYWYTAEHGLGYAFGVIGLALMAVLLLYPLRKHWSVMSRMFPIRIWFRMHMLFGVLGPVFVLFHANFTHTSLNNMVALYSMLLVAGSGLFGRYVYAKIHRGLYGKAIRYEDLAAEYLLSLAGHSDSDNASSMSIKAKLDSSDVSMVTLIGCQLRLKWQISRAANRNRRRSLELVARLTHLLIFSRLFHCWHVVHLPVFFMMLITAVLHIVAVHMY